MRSISMLAVALVATVPAYALTAASPTSPTPATTALVTGVEEPSANPTINAPVVQGCYSSSGDLVEQGTLQFNSKSSCAQDTCYAKNLTVAGTTGGNVCYCGDKYPSRSTKVADSFCNIGCAGYSQQACGGFDDTTNTYYWTIYNTGVSLAVESLTDDTPTKNTTSNSSSSTAPAATVYLSGTGMASPTTTPNSSAAKSGGGGKSNTVGIAVGVVVGLLALVALTGALFFYVRRKRSRELDEKHHRDAVINNFFGGAPGSSGGYSSSDARLDPVMAQRRVSNGSIADNQDYSRKILRVTNA